MTSHQTFTEFEAYKDAHEDVDIRLTLSHPERPHWSLHHLNVDSLNLQRGSDGCGDIAEGAVRQDGWILYFLVGESWQLSNGQLMTNDSVVVAGPGAEFCLASRGRHDWMTVFLPTASLFPLAGCGESISSSHVLRVVDAGHLLASRLRTTIGGFMAAAEVDQSIATEAAIVASFRDEVCRLAKLFIQEPTPTKEFKVQSADRQHLMSRAVELLAEWPHMSPTVSELARRLDVSERSLRSIFVDYLGMSPYQYLLARRLNHARQLLLNSDRDELTIGEAAAEVGFWDCGRFAAKYRRLFGELPSETLRRKQSAT